MNLLIAESNTKMETIRKMTIDNSIFNIPIVNSVVLFDTLDSTNTMAKTLAMKKAVWGTLIIADTQTAGRGRLGRTFSSPQETGIYMSILLKPDLSPQKISQTTLVTALATAKAIQEIPGIIPEIKWPNDILVNQKKVVGILTELSNDNLIIGIGINVNNEVFSPDIKDTATSLFLQCGQKLDRFLIIKKVLEKLSDFYFTFLDSTSLEFMRDDYNNMLASYNKDVFIIPHHLSSSSDNPYSIDVSGLIPHKCLGIDNDGNLICIHPDNTVEHIGYGEVSLRPAAQKTHIH